MSITNCGDFCILATKADDTHPQVLKQGSDQLFSDEEGYCKLDMIENHICDLIKFCFFFFRRTLTLRLDQLR